MKEFQLSRGLHVDGVCDLCTWDALVEASWKLGDRVLYHRSPNLRGDDVAELQQRLGRLGFDAGRVDGIFGPLTARALEEFQRNSGLVADGICGFETLQALQRLGDRTGHGRTPIAAVREHESLRTAPRTLTGRRVVVGHLGGLGNVSRAVARHLRRADAAVLLVDDPDQAHQAATANRYEADVFVGLVPIDAPSSTIAYYETTGFASIGGRRLARLIAEELARVLLPPAVIRGMRLPILRETRMPAVLCELGPVRAVVDAAPGVSTALCQAMTAWVSAPFEPST